MTTNVCDTLPNSFPAGLLESGIPKKREKCALAEHVLQNQHQIVRKNVKISEKEQHTSKRLILELFILSNK